MLLNFAESVETPLSANKSEIYVISVPKHVIIIYDTDGMSNQF